MRDRGRLLAIARGSHVMPPCPWIAASSSELAVPLGVWPSSYVRSLSTNAADRLRRLGIMVRAALDLRGRGSSGASQSGQLVDADEQVLCDRERHQRFLLRGGRKLIVGLVPRFLT